MAEKKEAKKTTKAKPKTTPKKKKETALAVKEKNALANTLSNRLTTEQKELIKRCFAKNATDDELDLYYNFCEKAGVDPLRGQSHFIKYNEKDKPIMMIGIDGFQARATSDPRYNGMASNVVYENDKFSMNPVEGIIAHEFGVKSRGKLVGAYAILKRTGMPHAVIWVELKDYDTGKFQWVKMKDVMIVKVAKASLLRREYPDNFSAVYVPEEFGSEITEKGEFIEHKEYKEPVKIPEQSKKEEIHDDNIKDAEFEEVPDEAQIVAEEENDNQEEPEDDSQMGKFIQAIKDKELITKKMTPREAVTAIDNIAFPKFAAEFKEMILGVCPEFWEKDMERFQIPESACMALVRKATGIKLKMVEKTEECKVGPCENKLTAPEAEEHDDLCNEHWKEQKD